MSLKKFDFYFIMLSLIVSAQLSAQLYVDNNYVYVADSYLYVNQDVNLQTSGNIFLRNGSQLLQGTTGGSANQGLGTLAVFQEGTSNNYAYNYWCSPVGSPSASVGNGNFGASLLNRPTSLTSSMQATLLPPAAQDGTTTNFSLAIAPRWIFKFLSSSLYSQWFSVGSATAIAAGEGFTMKGTSGTDNAFSENGIDNNPGNKQRYDFRGKPNDGNITISLATGMRTLTGNPYPSAIDLKAFLLAATNSTGVAYFWEQDKTVSSHFIAAYKGGYGVYSPMGGPVVGAYANMGIYTPAVFYAYDAGGTQLGVSGAGSNYERRFCPIGQGFMLEGSATSSVTMSNNFRVYQKEGAANYSEFERPAGSSNVITPDVDFLPAIPSVSGFDYNTVSTLPVPQIRFNTLLNNTAVRQTVLAFHPGATDGADFGMDARLPDSNGMDMYFLIDGREYVLDAIAFDIAKRISVGFRTLTPASFRIAVGEVINFTAADNVYLHDKGTDIYHDIKHAEYEMTLPAGTWNDRFEITFVAGPLAVDALESDNFEVVQNNILQALNIHNPKSLNVQSVKLYDLNGKVIFDKQNQGSKSNYQYSTSGISDSVYIVQVTTIEGKEFIKKVTIHNGK